MGFFKDFKNDLSETVSELNDTAFGKTEAEDTDDVMVNTLDDPDLAKMAADLVREAGMEDGQDTQEERLPVQPSYEAESSLAADETAVITKGLNITGDLNSTGSIEIYGTVTGNVECLGKLTVTGSISGDSKADSVFANNAQIGGNIEAAGAVKVGQGTVIVGNITADSAVIAGAVKGDIDVHGPVVIDSSAIIVGDIKSKTVQINNGATIDGRCSQCYAEVNTESVFDIK